MCTFSLSMVAEKSVDWLLFQKRYRESSYKAASKSANCTQAHTRFAYKGNLISTVFLFLSFKARAHFPLVSGSFLHSFFFAFNLILTSLSSFPLVSLFVYCLRVYLLFTFLPIDNFTFPMNISQMRPPTGQCFYSSHFLYANSFPALHFSPSLSISSMCPSSNCPLFYRCFHNERPTLVTTVAHYQMTLFCGNTCKHFQLVVTFYCTLSESGHCALPVMHTTSLHKWTFAFDQKCGICKTFSVC